MKKDGSMSLLKRGAALLLSVFMVVTFMPVWAWADAAEEQAPAAEELLVPDDAVTEVQEGAADADANVTEDAVQSEAVEVPAESEVPAPAAAEDADVPEAADDNAAAPAEDEAGEPAEAEPEEFSEEVFTSEEQFITADLGNLNIGDSDALLSGYIKEEAGIDDKADPGDGMNKLEMAPRSWYLSGRNLVYYNYVKSLAGKVASGGQVQTMVNIPGAKILSKKTYTAAELGLSTIATRPNGKWVLTSAAINKINKLMSPEDWNKVMTAALLDMPYDLYWYNRFNGEKTTYSSKWHVTFNDKTLTFDTSASETYSVVSIPLMEEYAQKTSDNTKYYIYKADTTETSRASTAVANAKAIVNRYTGVNDAAKLNALLNEVCRLTDYNEAVLYYAESAGLSNVDIYSNPWQLIYVFDGDSSTKVVCAGYGKAFKFLCDLSTFQSDWIECQTIYGDVSSGGSGGAHLWCKVRMNDGQNYIVDPTWHDGGYDLFLKGGTTSGNSVTVATTYKGSPREVTYTPNDGMRKLFSAAELRIASNDYVAGTADKKISISGARVSNVKAKTYTGKKLTQSPKVVFEGKTLKAGTDYTLSYSANLNVGTATMTITGRGQYNGTKKVTFKINPKSTKLKSVYKAKKAFTVKWNKQAAKMSTSTITGYEIQYSTKKNFSSGNKSVKVKGFKKTYRKVSKLKAKTTYYVRIRTYKTVSGKTYYSSWSSAKSVKTK